ncbi:hypothetical protein BDZ89DRAFT_71620 [Hymenopellis radicata]|nr:hypothetical protein BDZ89DRAFT_71620 [Hymenopellis radicata]
MRDCLLTDSPLIFGICATSARLDGACPLLPSRYVLPASSTSARRGTCLLRSRYPLPAPLPYRVCALLRACSLLPAPLPDGVSVSLRSSYLLPAPLPYGVCASLRSYYLPLAPLPYGVRVSLCSCFLLPAPLPDSVCFSLRFRHLLTTPLPDGVYVLIYSCSLHCPTGYELCCLFEPSTSARRGMTYATLSLPAPCASTQRGMCFVMLPYSSTCSQDILDGVTRMLSDFLLQPPQHLYSSMVMCTSTLPLPPLDTMWRLSSEDRSMCTCFAPAARFLNPLQLPPTCLLLPAHLPVVTVYCHISYYCYHHSLLYLLSPYPVEYCTLI